MINFKNISSLTNVRCSFPLYQNQIILESPSWLWISTIFHHWLTSYVLFLFVKMGSFESLPHDDEFQPYWNIDESRMFFFSSWKSDHFRIALTMVNFNNISSLSKVPCSFSLYQNKIIWESPTWLWISTISHYWGKSDVVFLFIKIGLFWNVPHDDEFQQYFVIHLRAMFFFSEEKSQHDRICFTMNNFNNISSLTNVRCSFSRHQNEIILQSPSWWWISTICHHRPRSHVLFLFIKITGFQNFLDDDEFQQYFNIDQRAAFFFSSSKSDHFSIALIMMNFNIISSWSNVGCSFSLHRNEITLEIFSSWWISTILRHWPTFNFLFLVMKIRSFENFVYDDEFRPYFNSNQSRMFYFSSWKSDRFRISLTIVNFNNISLLSNVPCCFCLHQNQIILESPSWL